VICVLFFPSMSHIIQLAFTKSMLSYTIILLIIIWWLVLLLCISLDAMVVIALMCMEWNFYCWECLGLKVHWGLGFQVLRYVIQISIHSWVVILKTLLTRGEIKKLISIWMSCNSQRLWIKSLVQNTKSFGMYKFKSCKRTKSYGLYIITTHLFGFPLHSTILISWFIFKLFKI